MGACCTKPKVSYVGANEIARNHAILILHAYKELPECAKGHATRKRRGSFVLIEHETPMKRVRTEDMIAQLEKTRNIKHKK